MSPTLKTQAAGAGARVLWEMLGDKEHLHDLADYEQAGGYEELRRALSMDGDALIDIVKASGIRGRGGAGFPTGMKMGFIPKGGDKPIYLVCNADESEPCTFKDREIIERLPHLLIEGCMIAAHAIGAESAFIYIRGEYFEPFVILRAAAEQAHAKGYIGPDVMGSGKSIGLVIHRGAGAYICGEETALLSSLNGERGQPTVKPPFPAISGLYAAPTLVNNVETLSTLPRIMKMGGETYSEIGAGKAGMGTRVFSLSGHVNRPGNYEVDMGTPFKDLIFDLGGGIPDGRALKAVIPGGSSMPILTPEMIEVARLDFDSMAELGSMLGSGSVIVLDERVCMVQLALRVAEFYKHESCGKCTPCREGTRWVTDLLVRMEAGEGRMADIELLESVNNRVLGNCLCPLGDAMAMPVLSYIQHYRDDFVQHVEHGGCPYDHSPLEEIARRSIAKHDFTAATGLSAHG
jgi:NADH-quinone oxidoreductase subunit F